MENCNGLAAHLRSKIENMCQDLKCSFSPVDQIEMSSALSSHGLLHQFQLVWPEEVDTALGHYKATASLVHHCPSLLLTSSKITMVEWASCVLSASLQESYIPFCLK